MQAKDPWGQWHPWMIAAVALLLGLLLRLPGTTDRGPWLDERVSLIGAMGQLFDKAPTVEGVPTTPKALWASNNLVSVLRANQVNDGANASAYQLLLHGWIRVFGPSDASARSLSLVFGLGTLILVFFLGREVGGDGMGALAVLGSAVHPLLIRYSQEVRTYSLATFLALGATLVLLQALASDRQGTQYLRWAIYGVLSALAVLCHLLVLPLLAGHFLLFCLPRKREQRVGCAGALTLMAMLLLPWIIVSGPQAAIDLAARSAFYGQQAVAGNPEYWWVHPASPKYVVGGLLGASLTMFGFVIPAPRVALAAFALVLPATVLLLAARSSVPAKLRKVLFLGFIGLPFAVVSALRAGHDLPFQSFYFNFYAPLIMVAMAGAWVLLWQQRHPKLYWLASLQIGLVVVSLAGTLPTILRDRRPNVYVGLVQAIREAPQVLRVEVPTWSDAQILSFYLGPTATPRFHVTAGESDGIRLIDQSGAILKKVHIDRAAAH